MPPSNPNSLDPFELSPQAATPLYRQIVEQVQRLVAGGVLAPGPSCPAYARRGRAACHQPDDGQQGLQPARNRRRAGAPPGPGHGGGGWPGPECRATTALPCWRRPWRAWPSRPANSASQPPPCWPHPNNNSIRRIRNDGRSSDPPRHLGPRPRRVPLRQVDPWPRGMCCRALTSPSPKAPWSASSAAMARAEHAHPRALLGPQTVDEGQSRLLGSPSLHLPDAVKGASATPRANA